MRRESILQGVESEQVEKLRKQLDDMASQREQLNKDLLSSQTVQMQHERVIEGLRADLSEEKLKSNGMSQLKDDNERLKLELFESKGKDLEREMAISSLKQTVDFKDQHIERLNGDLETARIERDTGIQKESLRLGAEAEQVERLRKQLDAVSTQREELSQKVLSAEASQFQFERTIQGLRADVDAEKAIVMTLQAQLEAARAEHSDKAFGAKGELERAQRKLQDAADEIEDLTAALRRSDEELAQFRSEKQANKELRKSLDLNQRQSKVNSMAETGMSQMKMERDVEDLIKHVGVSQQNLNSIPNASGKVTSLSNLREVFDVQHRNIQDLQKELQAVKAERDAVVRGTTTKRHSVEELVDVRRQLQTAEAERDALRAELQAKSDNQMRSSVTDVVVLRKQVSALEVENSQLRTERKSLVDKADQAKRQSLEVRQRLSLAEAEVQQRKATEELLRSTSGGSTQREQAMTSLRRKVDFEVEEPSARGRNSQTQLDVDLTQDEEPEQYDIDLTEEGVVKAPARTSSWMQKSSLEDNNFSFVETPPMRRSDALDVLSGSPVERQKLSMSSRGSGK
jgi:chromosome segregation ATPase